MEIPKYIVFRVDVMRKGTSVELTNITDEVEDVILKADRKTEPTISKMEQVETMSCQECKHFHENAVMYLDQCDFCFKDCKYESKDEPQTDCAWK